MLLCRLSDVKALVWCVCGIVRSTAPQSTVSGVNEPFRVVKVLSHRIRRGTGLCEMSKRHASPDAVPHGAGSGVKEPLR